MSKGLGRCWLLWPGCPSDEIQSAACCPLPTASTSHNHKTLPTFVSKNHHHHLGLFCKKAHLSNCLSILTTFLYREPVVFATFHLHPLIQAIALVLRPLHHTPTINTLLSKWLLPLRPTPRSGSRPSCLRRLWALPLHEPSGPTYEIATA